MSRLIIVATNHKEDKKLTKAKLKEESKYKPDVVLLEYCPKALKYMKVQKMVFTISLEV